MALFRRENIAVPDERKDQIVYKWPDLQIRRFTKAIVAPDEVAVFLYQGQVIGTLPPGRHQVDATELPFLGMFKDILTGGNAYRTELYFVSATASAAGSTRCRTRRPGCSSPCASSVTTSSR
jgi:membrane protease subunit (stomatin/prohibitin family)